MGLWIIQNCKREWDKQGSITWGDIIGMALAEPEFVSLIDVNAHEFFDGQGMVDKIQQFCSNTGQSVPLSIAQIARTVFESLAFSYREAFLRLEQIRGGNIDVLHIVGGGANNSMLNQMTANAIGRPVVTGPSEATAIGNLMVQVMASGEVANLDEMRQVIRNSFNVKVYEPQDTERWQEQFERYLKLKR